MSLKFCGNNLSLSVGPRAFPIVNLRRDCNEAINIITVRISLEDWKSEEMCLLGNFSTGDLRYYEIYIT